MTKLAFSTTLAHTSLALFRTWGTEFRDSLIAIGLTKTTDTGQIDWTTNTLPGDGGVSGYETYSFNDAQQTAGKTIFFKVEYGTRFSGGDPQMWITVGTGTNGAGTITGVMFARTAIHENSNVGSGSTPYLSNFCYREGFFGFAFKRGWAPNTMSCLFFFAIARTVDDTGAPNGDGVSFYHALSSSAGVAQSNYSYLTGTVLDASPGQKAYCMIVGGVTNSLVGSAPQVYKHYTRTPRVRPMPFMLTAIKSEMANNAVLAGAAPVASAAHDYIAMHEMPLPALNGVTASHTLMMCWE